VILGQDMCGAVQRSAYMEGRAEGKGLLGGGRHRWEDKITIYLKEIVCVCVGVYWNCLAQDED
jgi:hypothetical protein